MTSDSAHDARDDGAPGRVVVGVDGSQGAAEALRWAWREGQLRGLVVEAVLVWGYLDQHHPGGGRDFEPGYNEEAARSALDAAVTAALGADASSVLRRVVCDLPARALLEAGAGAALLVVGARGLGGFKGMLLGSVSQHCLHHAPCPVAVVRPATVTHDEHRVVVGVDGSPSSIDALRWAIDEAQLRSAAVIVVHGWQLPYVGGFPLVSYTFDPAMFDEAANATVDAALAQVSLPPQVEVIRHVIHGAPSHAIIEAAKSADLVVVGARGLGGFTGLLLGSVSQHVARHAPCDVVVIPSHSTS